MTYSVAILSDAENGVRTQLIFTKSKSATINDCDFCMTCKLDKFFSNYPSYTISVITYHKQQVICEEEALRTCDDTWLGHVAVELPGTFGAQLATSALGSS